MARTRIVLQAGEPPVAFAANEIVSALRELGLKASVVDPSAPASNGPTIALGVAGEPWLAELARAAGVKLGQPKPEGYALMVSGSGDTLTVLGVGGDVRGAMYAGLEAAEQIALGGSLEAIEPKEQSPTMAFRAVDHPLPLRGKYPASLTVVAYDWARNLMYWQGYLDQMARNRCNALVLITSFDYMVPIPEYPEASGMTDSEMARNVLLFKSVIRMANERAIDVYLMQWWDGWNISYSLEFAEAHGLCEVPLPEGTRLPVNDGALIKDYTRAKVKALLETYEDVTGLCCAIGERMPGLHVGPRPNPGTQVERTQVNVTDLWYNARWIKETWFKGIAEAGRNVPFLLRAWWTRPEVAQEILCADYPGQVIIQLKYNGEHSYSSPKPHYYNPDWLEQEPRDYDLIWELTIQTDVIMFRWGDPDWVREWVGHASKGSIGARFPTSERAAGRIDIRHTDAHVGHVTWQHEYQRHWFANMLWGRLSYDPTTPNELFAQHFQRRFGPGGRDAYLALKSASAVLPTATCFHWNYMNGDWQPEFAVGGWNTAIHSWMEEGIGNYREVWKWCAPEKFHTLLEWVFNHTIDGDWMPIPRYVNTLAAGGDLPQGIRTPPAVAETLERASSEALAHLAAAAEGVDRGVGEFECLSMDVRCVAALGRYFARKIEAATEIMFFLRTGDASHQEACMAHLESAAEAWRELAHVGGEHYQQGYALGWPAMWSDYLRDLDHDIEIARQLGDQECPVW